MTESTTKPPFEISCLTSTDCSNVTNAICDTITKLCECGQLSPIFVSSVSECVKESVLNGSCSYNEQCLVTEDFSECSKNRMCECIVGYEMKSYPDVGLNCVTSRRKSSDSGVDPTMIIVLVALALMFIIICVVLRLFSKARFRENRSIFNTPNPRLMNASLFKDSKLLSPARGERRGSRASVRGPPSRTASIASVNKDGAGRSPSGSLTKGRRGSTLSTASATGSAAAASALARKSPSPTPEETEPAQTTVDIQTVD